MSLSDRVSLRVKLVAALLTLATVGLVAAGTTGVIALRGYLLDRVDAQLEATIPMAALGPRRPTPPGPLSRRRSTRSLPGPTAAPSATIWSRRAAA